MSIRLMQRLAPAAVAERLLTTLWVGGLWAVGYVAAPIVFAVLDERHLAGTVAGRMFSAMSYVGLVCGALLLAGFAYLHGANLVRQWRVWVVAAMIGLVLVGELVLQPSMAALRETGLVEGSAEAREFARLHGIAATLYLATSVLGLGLVIGRTETPSFDESAGRDTRG